MLPEKGLNQRVEKAWAIGLQFLFQGDAGTRVCQLGMCYARKGRQKAIYTSYAYNSTIVQKLSLLEEKLKEKFEISRI